MSKYVYLNGISQKLFLEAFAKVNKIPRENFKNGDSMLVETGKDVNYKLIIRFVSHYGNKDWSVESIDILDKDQTQTTI